MTLSQLTELLGWASLINISFLCIATFSLIIMRGFITDVHSQLFNMSKEELPNIYFTYLANYKSLSLIFFVVPYISLKLMGN